MFTVTDEAVKMVKELEKKTEGTSKRITIFSSGVGCGGPALKVGMELPLDDDTAETVNTCTFYIRASILKFLEGSHIDAVETFWGKRLYVKTTYGCL